MLPHIYQSIFNLSSGLVSEELLAREMKLESQQQQRKFVGPNRIIVGDLLYIRQGEKIYDSPPSYLLREIPLQSVTESLRHQIRITQSLSHPNILKVFDSFEQGQNLYILKQKCDGKLEVEPDNVEALDDIVKQILTAMHYLQSLKIFHRNLKGSTIYMNDGVCKVKGLGYAIVMDDQYQCVQGDPHQNDKDFEYRCPQMLKGQKYGMKSDIWSLGVVLYELIYGQKPWQADTVEQYMKVIENEPLVVPYDCKFSPIIKEMLQVKEIERCEWDILYQSVGIYTDENDVTEKLSLMISLTNLGKEQSALQILEEQMSDLGQFPDDQFDGSQQLNPWFVFGVALLLML